MFLFYDSKQNDKNASYYKGVLFEKLLSEYLSKNGYSVKIRQKHNSLEYDLEGNDINTQIHIIGEAKAYKESISGQILSAFVGKLLPFGLVDKKVHGLFFSTSPLTPEANNYYQSIQNLGIQTHCGEELFLKILLTFNLPNKQQVFLKTEEIGFKPLFDFLLTTDTGYNKLVIACTPQALTPSHFLVYDSNLNLVNDETALKSLGSMNELRDLSFFSGITAQESLSTGRKIQEGLLLGKDWSDYRFPANPQYFIGRKELTTQIIDYINSTDSQSKVIQIKSRSGVGKSSLLALLNNKLTDYGYYVELHDARDIKTVIDVFTVIGRLLKTNNLPQDFNEVESKLMKLGSDTTKYVFMVDQFESTFFNPDVFFAYETLAKIICTLNKNIYFCIARKNDQLTTYDDSLISLSQLNNLSKNYELKDFTVDEAKELLKKINSNLNKKISNSVLGYVLEFSQGFPWLLKRTMFHIIKFSDNVSEKKLIDTGLMLDDLFDEELEGLEEIEKEYLSKVCAKLPADFHQLHLFFEEDNLLPKMLDKFTESRLLRLSGTTYDTYNDVFKEYLVYQKLPQFRQKHIFRQNPNSVTNFFSKIIEYRKFTISQLANNLKINEKTLANLIIECRNLGLIKKEDNYWTIPQNVRDIFIQGHLGLYLKNQIMNNEFVIEIVKKITVDSLDIDSVGAFMKELSPYVDASEATWKSYANVLVSWMTATCILDKENSTKIVLSDNTGKNLPSELGNLLNSKYGKRGGTRLRTELVPTCVWMHYESAFTKYQAGVSNFTKEEQKAIMDLKAIKIFDFLDNFKTVEEFKENIKIDFFSTPTYNKIWTAAQENADILTAVSELLESEVTESTLVWRAKKIVNCGKNLGLLENRRYHYKGNK